MMSRRSPSPGPTTSSPVPDSGPLGILGVMGLARGCARLVPYVPDRRDEAAAWSFQPARPAEGLHRAPVRPGWLLRRRLLSLQSVTYMRRSTGQANGMAQILRLALTGGRRVTRSVRVRGNSGDCREFPRTRLWPSWLILSPRGVQLVSQPCVSRAWVIARCNRTARSPGPRGCWPVARATGIPPP